jgi:hypothetical protein
VKKAAILALAGAVLALSTTAAAAPNTHNKGGAPGVMTLIPASALPRSTGPAAPPPRGWMPLHGREFALAKAAANARAGVSSSGRRGGGGGSGPVVTPYANVSPSFNGTFYTGATPPDTTGAIGPDRYIETVNTQYAIYSRFGSLINSGSLSALTGISTGFFGYSLSDPQMMWDAQTQRFYYSAVYYDSLFLSDNGLAVGWSKTATPSSSADFCQYAISAGTELPDYPKLGDSPDFLMYGYNLFGNFASTYDGSEYATLNKPPAGSTCPPASAFSVYTSGVLRNADGSLASTPVPANLVDDSTGTGYVVANADLSTTPSANFLSVYSVTKSGTDANGLPIPSFSGPTNVGVNSYSMPPSAPQKGSSYLLDTLDGRFEAAVAAVDPNNGNAVAIWTAHAVAGGAGSEERWYEINPSGSLFQSGVVNSPSLFVWNGAVSPDRANNGTTASFGGSMAMSVSTSSTSAYPAIQFVWKNATGTQSALTNLVQSGGASVDLSCSSTAPCRWGDYSGASPDPAASGAIGKVWLANQYSLAGGSTSGTAWRTWLFGVTPSP